MAGAIGIGKQVVLAAAVVAGAALLWQEREHALAWLGASAGAEDRQSGARDEGVPVLVAPVEIARDDLVLEAVGTGRAQRSVGLRAETAGKITEIALEAGRRFAKDDVLLRLDDRDQQLALSLAEARQAEAARRLERYSRLEGSGAATTATLDEVSTTAEVARIELEQARQALEDRTLRAPFDGVSGLPAVEVGDRIDTDDEIASFDDRSVVLVEFELPEALLARVEPDMGVSATTPAVPGRAFEGTVSAINSRVDAESRTARVRVAIPNPDDVLRPGASFSVRLALPGGRYPVVPELALQFSRGTLHVWRVVDGRSEQVEVDLIRRRAGEVLVDGPLGEGDLVVVEGTQRLEPGRAVRVLDVEQDEST